MSFVMESIEDLHRLHESLQDWGWSGVAVQDRDGQPWLLAEHDNGDLYVHCGDEDGWTDAEFLIEHRAPVTVLSPVVIR